MIDQVGMIPHNCSQNNKMCKRQNRHFQMHQNQSKFVQISLEIFKFFKDESL